MSLWLFNVYMDAVMKVVKMGDVEEERDWRLPDLLHAYDLILCGVGGRPEGNGGMFC